MVTLVNELTNLNIQKEFGFVTGGNSPNNGETELLDLKQWKWNNAAKYPYAADIYDHAAISHQSMFYIFGSANSGGSQSSLIARFDPATNVWSQMGNLSTGVRYFYNVIFTEDTFLVVGGSSKFTEKCTLNGDTSITCVSESELDTGSNPQLFNVDSSYCN